MAVDTVSTIFTLLLGGGLAAVVGAWAFAPALRDELRRAALPLAWVVALGSTLGSLWYSEVQGFVPCEMCWYQRIAMYPLAMVLGIAAARRDAGIALYTLPLAIVGAVIAAYHYQLQLFPSQGSSCSPNVPCTMRWIDVFGFVTIPLLALAGFALIAVLLVIARSGTAQGGEE